MQPNVCRGCLRCELACSFHKSKHRSFNPAISATKVLRNNVDKSITMMIDDTCDLCTNEDAPFCVMSCVFGARGTSRGEKK